MNNFKDGGFKKSGGNFGGKPRFGGNRNGGGKSFGGGGHRGDKAPQRFQATCATCKKSCEVPFRPSNDKPVYCSECFGRRTSDEANPSRGGDRRDFTSRQDSRPRHDERPARHDHTPEKRRDSDGELKQRLAIIETKLNKILDLINPPTKPESRFDVVTKATVIEPAAKRTAKPEKKVVDKPALKKAVAKAVKTTVTDKEVNKKTPKKVVKKAAKKAVK